MTRQQKLDAFARSKGYPSYFAYRNARAKAEGYSSYAALRRARAQSRTARTVPTPTRSTTPQRPVSAQNPANDLTRSIRLQYRGAARLGIDNSIEAARININRQRTPATKDSLVRPVLGAIDNLDDEVRSFFRTEFRQAYAAGARAANPNWKPSREDMEYVQRLAGDAQSGLLRNNEAARRSARITIPRLVDMERPKALALARRNPIKGTRQRNGNEVGFAQHGEAALRAITARAYNTAYVKTAQSGGAQLFQVFDGPDCGWLHHRDTELAAGKIVTAQEAMGNPIAHPNCVRGFAAAPQAEEPTKGSLRRAARAVGRAAAASARATAASNALSLARHLASDVRVQEAARKVASSGRADFLQYKQNLAIVARLYEQSLRQRQAAMGNVRGMRTRAAPNVDARDVADDVIAWIDDFAEGEEVPEHVLQIIGVPVEAGRKVVGDRLETFTTMYNSTFRSAVLPIKRTIPTKTIGRPTPPPRRREPPTTRQRFERIAANQFYNWLGPRVPQFKYLKYTFPNINGSVGFLDRPRRLSTSLGDMVKVTRTSIKDRGVINHLSLNPNGLLRLSLTKDPETGWVTPTFRLIPPGPLHIMTKVNRGIEGNITSLSGEVRLVTGQRIAPSVAGRFNINLRKLGLDTLEDIKRLRLEDFRKFDRDDIRGVSIATNLRLRGYNLFDLSRTFRLPWEEAEKLWQLSNFELGEIAAEIRAQNARKKLRLVEGGLSRIRVPPSPGAPTARPVLRIVDPDTGDPFGPGSRPSFAPQIVVPSSLQSAPARRAYIEARLTNAERERVAAMRLAGDYSTIRHLRNRDRLTWEQIAVEMKMSIGRVKKIYKGGTSNG